MHISFSNCCDNAYKPFNETIIAQFNIEFVVDATLEFAVNNATNF